MPPSLGQTSRPLHAGIGSGSGLGLGLGGYEEAFDSVSLLELLRLGLRGRKILLEHLLLQPLHLELGQSALELVLHRLAGLRCGLGLGLGLGSGLGHLAQAGAVLEQRGDAQAGLGLGLGLGSGIGFSPLMPPPV